MNICRNSIQQGGRSIGWALMLSLMLMLVFAPFAAAQNTGSKTTIDSPEKYQRRLKNMITERVATIIPSGKFVVGVTVEVSREGQQNLAAPFSGVELPGFRANTERPIPSASDRYLVDHVTVRVATQSEISDGEQKYIRDLVPILADQEPGDVTLEIILSPPTAALEEAAIEDPEKDDTPLIPTGEGEKFYGLTLLEWIIVGFAALLVLVMLWGLMRMVSAWTRPKPLPAPPPPPPPPPPDAVEVKNKEIEDERKKLESVRHMGDLRHSVVKSLFSRPELALALVSAWKTEGQKFANLIHALGPSLARQAILPHMSMEEYAELEKTVLSGNKQPDESSKLNALQEAKVFLVSEELTNPEVIRPNPFTFVDKLSWGQIAHLIKEEPVRVKAILLSRTPPDVTARILETLPKEMQLEIAVNIGNLKDMPLEMAESVALDLAEKARHVPDARLVEIEGPRALVDMMGRTSSVTSRYLLTAMKAKDRELSEEVEKRFFLFEALPLVPSEIVPQAVRTMSSSIVITAIQGADSEIQRKVIMAFPESARPSLATALRGSRADPEAVEDARRQVVYKFQQLAEQGKIDLKKISDAWQASSQAS